MTSRRRMLTAIANGVPDRVPVAPDISCMVPVRVSGRSYLDVFVHGDPPLWRAYLAAAAHFGIDAWFTYAGVGFETEGVTTTSRWIVDEPDRKVRETTFHTSEGPLTEHLLIGNDKPPVRVKKMIEDVDRDWPRFRRFLGPIAAADPSLITVQREALGERGALGAGIATPGFQIWNEYFEGGIVALSYLAADRPALLDELRELHHARLMSELDHLVRARPDFVLTGGSGSITLSSPDLWRRYSFPTLQEQCRVCAAAGIPTMVHSCGKQRAMLVACAAETRLNCINPLEIPPMGDVVLADAKRIVRGSRLALMGNLHTTGVMLSRDVEAVKRAARQAIEDAGAGGGFILSTGDQCGRDTPDANLFALVETAEEHGRYR
jgi:uroporphyrinogen decarboxylase